MFALTRYESVIRALKDASTLSSASGVMMNDDMNASDDGFSCDSRVLRFGVAIPALISVYLSRESRGIDFFGSERNETPDISINMGPTAESGAHA